MGILEWLFLIVIVLSSYKTYTQQDHWLDRKLAWLIKNIRSWCHAKDFYPRRYCIYRKPVGILNIVMNFLMRKP